MYRLQEPNPQLQDSSQALNCRMERYAQTKARLLSEGRTLTDFANACDYFGIHHIEGGWVCREWAPHARQLYFAGEFNGWKWEEQPMFPLGNGCWVLYLQGDSALWEGCKVKIVADGSNIRTEHIPLYARQVAQEPSTGAWCAEVVDDRKQFEWTDGSFRGERSLRVYEAHTGNYREFADHTLHGVREAGYNTVQLMEISEPSSYGFRAADCRFGKPEDLKYLVNKAHEMGIRVLLEVVCFQAGAGNDHPVRNTKRFDCSKPEMIHFLLSDLKFWMTEYHFDGFCFSGLTAMLRRDCETDAELYSNDLCFFQNIPAEAVTCLQLANELIRQVNPDAITIVRDMSGVPGMCLPIEEGGIGFDCWAGMVPKETQ